jgi:homoserine O-acetyltransferase
VTLEAGQQLPDVTIAYETYGELAPARDNAVLVLHALTGDSHAAGPAGPGHPTPGWWDGLIGPGRALDTERWYVVVPNVLGGCQGTTGPVLASMWPAPAHSEGSEVAAGHSAPSGGRFPRLTVRDQVAAEIGLADALGIDRWAAVVGGSMGGMRALEWAVTAPERVGSLVVLATTAAASAEQIAFCGLQVDTIRADPHWHAGDYLQVRHPSPEEAPATRTSPDLSGVLDTSPCRGPVTGLGLARRLAHLTYRSEQELATRFGRRTQDGRDAADTTRYAVQSYLDHHADKLVRRFDAASYVLLTDAMNSHDVGRGRGGVRQALARLVMPTLVVSIDSDRLYPRYQQEEIVRHAPGALPLRVVHSLHGHDGFLVETEQVAALVGPFLDNQAARVRASACCPA